MAVAIAFAVRFIVPLGIRDEIVQREAVMRGDEVDRCGRFAAVLVEEVGGTGKPCGKFAARACIAAPVAAHAVAKTIVPLGESRWMVAKLIAAGAKIPRLRYQLHMREHRILADRPEKTGFDIEPVRLAP